MSVVSKVWEGCDERWTECPECIIYSVLMGILKKLSKTCLKITKISSKRDSSIASISPLLLRSQTIGYRTVFLEPVVILCLVQQHISRIALSTMGMLTHVMTSCTTQLPISAAVSRDSSDSHMPKTWRASHWQIQHLFCERNVVADCSLCVSSRQCCLCL